MNIIQKSQLTEQDKRAIGQLVDACNQFDQTELGIYLGTEFNLYPEMNSFYLCYEGERVIGFLSAAVEEQGETDIKGCVLPEKRRMGIFRQLYDCAREELLRFGVERVNLVSQKSFLARNDFMSAFSAEFDEEEYQMRYVGGSEPVTLRTDTEIRHMRPDEIARGAEIWAQAFDDPEYAMSYVQAGCEGENLCVYVILTAGEVVGMGCIDLSGGGGFIYGLCVDPACQRMGFGMQLLNRMVANLRETGTRDISLRVDPENAKALPLYFSCGFIITSTIQYYRVTPPPPTSRSIDVARP